MQVTISKENIKEYNSTRSFFWRKIICYSPFNSLRFSLSGNIYFCCYNRFHSLGKYPEISIKEAWNGKKAQEFREKILKKDLSLGCHSCYSKIISKNYHASGSKIYDGFKITNEGPSLMDFEISNICNLECIMCNGENSSLIRHKQENGKPYPMVYDDNFLVQLKPFIKGLKEARFVGGEPFIIEYYYKIWELITTLNKKVKINILTNGTILNDRIIELYRNNNVHISFSIDSINNLTYNSIRVNGDYNKVKKNFEIIYSLSRKLKRELTVNICPIKKNMWEIPEMIKYYSELNIPIVFHTVIYPPSESISTLSIEELTKYIIFLQNSNILNSNLIKDNNKDAFKSFITQIIAWRDIKTTDFDDNDKSIEDLFLILYNHLTKATISFNNNLEVYFINIKTIINEISNEDIKRKGLIGLVKIDSNYIISELETSTKEKIKERIIAIAK